jgi:hypothetical protein
MTERLPLTPLEEYFLLEDRRAYPWSFFVRLDFTGRADRQAAETSLGNCALWHPLLSSVVHRHEDGQRTWRRVENPTPAVRWTTGVAEKAYASATRLDVSEEIGIRVHATVGQEGTQLIFQFNHACCDARGAFTFIEDWLAEYARATGGRPDPWMPRSYDPGLPDRRGRPGPEASRPFGKFLAPWAGLVRAYRFLAQSPAPLLEYQPAGDDDPTPAGFPAARHDRFDEAATAEIRSAARCRGVTVNDLLCRDLFLAIHGFRRELRQGQPDVWLRLAVPVDLRTEAQRSMSAANLASLVFVTRRASACNDSAVLLRSIHREMHQVKTWGLARTFLRSLRIQKRLPGGLSRAVRSGKCRATAALTNVGETLVRSPLPRKGGRIVAGNLLLDAAGFLAPVRPLTCASFASCTYAGRLSISLQYDPRGLSEPAADRLFDTFLCQVRSNLR